MNQLSLYPLFEINPWRSATLIFPMELLKSKLNDIYQPADCQSTALVGLRTSLLVCLTRPELHYSIDWLVNKCPIVHTNLMYCSVPLSQDSLIKLRVPSIHIETDHVLSTSVCRMTSCQIWCVIRKQQQKDRTRI